MQKKQDGIELELSFEWVEYIDVNIYAVAAKKRFDEVEMPINAVIGGDLGDFHTIFIFPDIQTTPTELHNSSGNNNVSFDIVTEKDAQLFIDFIEDFYFHTAIPFFEKCASSKNVNVELQLLLEEKRIQSLLTDSGGNSAIIRYYLIGLIWKNKYVLDFFENVYFPYLLSNKNNRIKARELEILNKIKLTLT